MVECTMQQSGTLADYAAWADPPSMKAVRLLLDKRKKGCDAGPDDDKDSTDDNARLLYVTDAHGKTPLDFVGTNHHGMWIEFLEGIKDEYWPVQERNESSSDQRNVGEVGVEYFPSSRWKSRRGTDNVSNFSALDRNNDIPDPQDALPFGIGSKGCEWTHDATGSEETDSRAAAAAFTLATESLTSTTTATTSQCIE